MNILKISFKRKKFFIHQRQKQVSCTCAVLVLVFLGTSALSPSAGEGICRTYNGEERTWHRVERKWIPGLEGPAVLFENHSIYLAGAVTCFGVGDAEFRS